jgi:hypothetical protein
MWKHAIHDIDEQINRIMESKYFILNKKLDKLLTRVKGTTTKMSTRKPFIPNKGLSI